MGFRNFPAESISHQKKAIKKCCWGNLKEWDCGCSWGCPQCYAAYQCKTCGHILGYEIGKLVAEGKCLTCRGFGHRYISPPLKKIECSDCGGTGQKGSERWISTNALPVIGAGHKTN